MENLSIYIITWNVATKCPEGDLLNLLNLDKDNNTLPDLYVIGLQEVKSQPQNFVMDSLFSDPWTNSFRNVLTSYDYIKVRTTRLVGLLLSVFCLRKHVVHVRDIHLEYTKTGLLGLWGNKGAVTIRFQIYGCSMCFINCHLAPHDNMIKERIDDYNTILQNQKFNVKHTANIFFHDYVFWFGDMNFRLNNEYGLLANEIVKEIKAGNNSYLLQYDQLKQVMDSGEAFSELVENGPLFNPTYRFNFHSQEYDTKRRPAWTDRILYRVNKDAYENLTLSVKQLNYRSNTNYSISDHKPVISELIVKVFSNHVENQVKLSSVGTWQIEKENMVAIKIEGDVKPSMWDWIGIYEENFGGLDEYVHYIYFPSGNNNGNAASHSTELRSNHITSNGIAVQSDTNEEQTFLAVFPDTAIRSAGTYRLLYITENFTNVLGMSESICVNQSESGSRLLLEW